MLITFSTQPGGQHARRPLHSTTDYPRHVTRTTLTRHALPHAQKRDINPNILFREGN